MATALRQTRGHRNNGRHSSCWFINYLRLILVAGCAVIAISDGLPTFISPWIDGKKAVMASGSKLTKADAVSVDEHERVRMG